MGLKELLLTAAGRVQLRDMLFGFDGRISRSQFWLAQVATIIIWVALLVTNLPAVIPVESCYLGWQQSLNQLQALVEPDISE